MKTEKAAEAFTAETVSMQLFARPSLLSLLPQAALLCALLTLGAAAPLSETRAQTVEIKRLNLHILSSMEESDNNVLADSAAVDASGRRSQATLVVTAASVTGGEAMVGLSARDVTEGIESSARLQSMRFSFSRALLTLPASESTQQHIVVFTYDSGSDADNGLSMSTHVLDLTLTPSAGAPETEQLRLVDIDALLTANPVPDTAVQVAVLRHYLEVSAQTEEPYAGGSTFAVSVFWSWEIADVEEDELTALLRLNPGQAEAALSHIIARVNANQDPVSFPFTPRAYSYRLEWLGPVGIPNAGPPNPDFMRGRGAMNAAISSQDGLFTLAAPDLAQAFPCTVFQNCNNQKLIDLVFTVDPDAEGSVFFYLEEAEFEHENPSGQFSVTNWLDRMTFSDPPVTRVQVGEEPGPEMLVLPAAVDASKRRAETDLVISVPPVTGAALTVNLSAEDVTPGIDSGDRLPSTRFSFSPERVTFPVSDSPQRHEVELTYDSGIDDDGDLTTTTHVVDLTLTPSDGNPVTRQLTLVDMDAVLEDLPTAFGSIAALRHTLEFSGEEPYAGGSTFAVSVFWSWEQVRRADFLALLRRNPAKAEAVIDEIEGRAGFGQIQFRANAYTYRLNWSGGVRLQSPPEFNNPNFMKQRGTTGTVTTKDGSFELSLPFPEMTANACPNFFDPDCRGQELAELVFTVDPDARGNAFFYPTNAVFTQRTRSAERHFEQDLIDALTLFDPPVTSVRVGEEPPALQLTLTDDALPETGGQTTLMVSVTGNLPDGGITVNLAVLDNHDSDTADDVELSMSSVVLTNAQRSREVTVTAAEDTLPEAQETVTIRATGTAAGATAAPAETDVTIGWNDYAVDRLALLDFQGQPLTQTTVNQSFRVLVSLNARAPSRLDLELHATLAGGALQGIDIDIDQGEFSEQARWDLPMVGDWVVSVAVSPPPLFNSPPPTLGVDERVAAVTAQAQDLEVVADGEAPDPTPDPTPLALQLTLTRDALPEAFGSTLIGLSFTGDLPPGEDTLTVNLSVSDAHDSDTEPDVRLSPTSRELTNTQRSTDVGLTLVNDALPEAQEMVTIRAVGMAGGETVTAEQDLTIGWNDYAVETLALEDASGGALTQTTPATAFNVRVGLNAAAPADLDLTLRATLAGTERTLDLTIPQDQSERPMEWTGGLPTAGNWVVSVVSNPLPMFASPTPNVDTSTAAVTAQAQTLAIVADGGAPDPTPLALQLTLARDALPEAFGATRMQVSFTGDLPSGETLTVTLSVLDDHDSDSDTDAELVGSVVGSNPDDTQVEEELTETQRSREVIVVVVNDALAEAQETVTIRATGTAAGVTVTPAERDVTIGWNDYAVQTLRLENASGGALTQAAQDAPFRVRVTLNAEAPADLNLTLRATLAGTERTQSGTILQGQSERVIQWAGGLPTVGSWMVEAVSDPLPDFSSFMPGVDASTATVTASAQSLEVVAAVDPGPGPDPMLTPPADFAEVPAQRQAYQLGFRWSAATDQSAMALTSEDDYRLLYAEPVSGVCPVENDTGYVRATSATITAGADPAADGFTAVVENAFDVDGNEKIKANTAYCIVLEVTDGANSVRTAPISAMTLEYSFADSDGDGLPDHLASLCVSCDEASKEADGDNDGIHQVLEFYLSEQGVGDSDDPAVDRDAYDDNNDNRIPDIVELHYGALDERTTAPEFDTVTCHASAWQTPALACRDENGSVSEGMRLLVRMDAQGKGIYVYDEMIVADRNTWLGSGTHWLMDAGRQLMRLDLLPLLSLSGPAEVAVTPGARASAGYAAKLSLQGPIALSGGVFEVQVQMQASFPDSESGMPTVSPESVTIDEVSGAQSVQVNLPTLAEGDDGRAAILAAVPDVNGSTQRISRRSFDDGAMTLSLRSLLTSAHLLTSTPATRPQAIIPYLVDGSRMGTPRIGSITLPETGDASWAAGATPGVAAVEFSCVEIPGVLADPAQGAPPVGNFIQFTLAAADRADPAPSAPAPAHAYFYNTDTLTVADCGAASASEHLLGQFAFLVFPAGSGDEDRDGNLIPDSQEGGQRSGVDDSGAAGLRYEVADGAAYYLRSPGRGLRLGAQAAAQAAAAQGLGTPNLLETADPAELEPPIPDILTAVDNLVLDFEAYCVDSPDCMQAGARVQFVFQVSVDIPPEVKYYKLAGADASASWCPMRTHYDAALPPLPPASLGCPDGGTHEDGLRDGLGFAAPDADGVCPPIGSAAYAVAPNHPEGAVYLDVPQAGDRCVQLSITNGGSNDRSDGVSNIVSDPGFLGVERGAGADSSAAEIKAFPDGAGGGSTGLPALLLLGLLTLLSLFAVRRAGFSALRTLPAVVGAALLALAPTQAQAQEPAWLPDAVSAAGGATFLDPDTASAFEVDDDEDSGWRLGMEWLWRDGVQLLPALPASDLFVELSYADLGEATVCADGGCTDGEFEVEYEVWSLGARSVWDWSHEMAPWLGKPFAGVGYRYGRSNEDMGEKNGAYWNAGFEWELGRTAAERGFSLRVFYEAYDADAGAVWAGLAWHPRTERRVAADKPRRPQVKRERVERRPAERRRAPTLMDGQCPVSVEDACACLEPVGRSPAGWYVQVIAYSQRAQAQQMRDRLAREGLRRLGLRTLSGSRGVVHAVRVASPRSCSAAMEIKERVDRMLEVNALVRPWYQSPW